SMSTPYPADCAVWNPTFLAAAASQAMVRGTRETVHIKRLLLAIVFLSATCFAARLRQVAIIDLPGQPGFDTVAIANGALLVAHSAADTVDIFDLTKRRIIAQVRHVRGASGIAVDEKNGRVFLSSPDR